MSYTTLRLGFFDEIKGQLAQRQIKETGVTRCVRACRLGWDLNCLYIWYNDSIL